MQQTSAVRSSIASAKRSGEMPPSPSGPDVHDLGAPELLGVRDLTDRGELVLADHDPVPSGVEGKRRDERAHALRHGRGDRDVVRLGVEQARHARAELLVPLDPEVPLRPVRVPAGEPLLDRRTNAVRERTLRAGVEVRRRLEDRELAADRSADAGRKRRTHPVDRSPTGRIGRVDENRYQVPISVKGRRVPVQCRSAHRELWRANPDHLPLGGPAAAAARDRSTVVCREPCGAIGTKSAHPCQVPPSPTTRYRPRYAFRRSSFSSSSPAFPSSTTRPVDRT